MRYISKENIHFFFENSSGINPIKVDYLMFVSFVFKVVHFDIL